MDYQTATQFAQTWGLWLLMAGFIAACVYALWPGNRETFDRAARAPLKDGDDTNG